MRLVKACVYRQFQPFAAGTYTCRGHTEHGFDSTILSLETDTGLRGWGEIAPLGSWYSAAFAGGARAGLVEVVPHLLGEDPTQLNRINDRMDELLNGHPYVKTPIDMACWDIAGQAVGLPLAELTGGRLDGSVALYRSVSQAAPAAMAAEATDFVADGYTRIQVKVGEDPAEDAQRLRAVKAAVGDGIVLVADANGAWSTDAAIHFATATADLTYFLEQPCMSLRENVAVRRIAPQPMILDESIESLEDLLAAHDAGVPNGITIKLSRVGGITKAVAIRDTAVSLGLQVCIEDTGGAEIDTAATTHLMASTPPAARLHTVDFMNWVTESNATGMPPTADGRITAPDQPGLGLEVDASRFGEPLFTIE